MNDNFLDVWHGELTLEESEKALCWSFLNVQEKEKSQTFLRKDLQQKYIKTRAVLRQILALYLDVSPAQIDFKLGLYGKPYVPNSSLCFNLSHSQNKYVIAVCNREVGIDLEISRERKNLSAMVNKCFSALEIQYWQSVPIDQRTAVFFQFWVRKEAFVKAVGRGIALGLNQCEINAEDQSCFLSIPCEYGLALEWNIFDISFDKAVVCAVVCKNQNITPRVLTGVSLPILGASANE